GLAAAAAAVALPEPYNPFTMFWRFLKIGGTLYGSGYVLIAFLQEDFVDRLGWITEQQLIDAVAVGQFTPGPVFSTATFVGYLAGGVSGAAIATVAIFLPAFVFIALTHRHVARIRDFPLASGFLDGVNAAAVALMAVVTFALGKDALIDAPTVLLAAGAALLLIRYRVNSALLIAAGALAGFLLGRLGGG
ncbi:MAG: chromate transporter, partial [Chloroflexota bacterium]